MLIAVQNFFFFLTLMLFFSMSQQAYAGLFAYKDKATELYGFKDIQGNIVVPPQFILGECSDQEVFTSKNKEYEFLVPVIKNGVWWRITQDGTLKFESVFFDNGADYYEEGLARFLKNGKVGFHDRMGNIVIEPIYDFASPFKNGYSAVCNECHAEYPKIPTYKALSSSACSFPREDMYKSVVGGRWGLVNKQGKIIVPLIHTSYEELEKAIEKKINGSVK